MNILCKQTFYMIAGSEIGEKVVLHPEMVDIYSEMRNAILKGLRDYNKTEE